jgi:hypothetical protein
MSSVPKQLATFAVVLAALFGVGAVAGQVIDPDAPGGKADAHGSTTKEMKDMAAQADSHGGEEAGGHGGGADPVRGLAVAENGLRVVVDDPEFRRGATEQLRFRIVDEHGETVRDFEVEATKRMHLIVARRDLTEFQHLHPEQVADGSWTVPLRLDQAGSYRLFADFLRDGKQTTLASDLRVDGNADLGALPVAETVATSDLGDEVRVETGGEVRAGKEAELTFTIQKNGRPVNVEPYLGAGGHLVALREGDLAYLHVHPITKADAPGPVKFGATFPTTGRYRLFLQFRDDGRVHTVAFTQEVK